MIKIEKCIKDIEILELIAVSFSLKYDDLILEPNYRGSSLTKPPFNLNHLDLIYLYNLVSEKYNVDLLFDALHNDAFYSINNIVEYTNYKLDCIEK